MAKTQSQITTLDDQSAPSTAAATTAEEAGEVRGMNHDAELSGETVMLTLHASDSEGGHEAVPIGVNGYMYQIPRGKPFRVPKEVAGVIETAVTTSYKIVDGRPQEFTSPRFAFSTTP